MIYEIHSPVLSKDLVKFSGLVSLPEKSDISDKLFISRWGAKTIRPVVQGSGNVSNLGLNDKNFEIYCEKILELLKELKLEFPEVIFIDIRFSDSLKDDIVVNYKSNMNSSHIIPVLKNLEFSENVKWAENIQVNFKLIEKIGSALKGVIAFQLILSSKLVGSNEEKALKLVQEAIIYSHLAVTGQI